MKEKFRNENTHLLHDRMQRIAKTALVAHHGLNVSAILILLLLLLLLLLRASTAKTGHRVLLIGIGRRCVIAATILLLRLLLVANVARLAVRGVAIGR